MLQTFGHMEIFSGMPQVFYQIQFWIYLLLKYLFQSVYYHPYVFNPLINFECLFP